MSLNAPHILIIKLKSNRYIYQTGSYTVLFLKENFHSWDTKYACSNISFCTLITQIVLHVLCISYLPNYQIISRWNVVSNESSLNNCWAGADPALDAGDGRLVEGVGHQVADPLVGEGAKRPNIENDD